MITDAAKRFQGLELSEIKWHRKFSTQTSGVILETEGSVRKA